MKEFLKTNWHLFFVLFTMLLVGFLSVVFLGNDNSIEQQVEKVIQEQTGVKVDLTPTM